MKMMNLHPKNSGVQERQNIQVEANKLELKLDRVNKIAMEANNTSNEIENIVGKNVFKITT